MAFGYAQATGRPGTCLVVPGPGVLNTTAALSTAYACNAPVLCVTGQIPSGHIGGGLGFLHEIPDQLRALASVSKWQARIDVRGRHSARRRRGLPAAEWRPPAAGRHRDSAGRRRRARRPAPIRQPCPRRNRRSRPIPTRSSGRRYSSAAPRNPGDLRRQRRVRRRGGAPRALRDAAGPGDHERARARRSRHPPSARPDHAGRQRHLARGSTSRSPSGRASSIRSSNGAATKRSVSSASMSTRSSPWPPGRPTSHVVADAKAALRLLVDRLARHNRQAGQPRSGIRRSEGRKGGSPRQHPRAATGLYESHPGGPAGGRHHLLRRDPASLLFLVGLPGLPAAHRHPAGLPGDPRLRLPDRARREGRPARPRRRLCRRRRRLHVQLPGNLDRAALRHRCRRGRLQRQRLRQCPPHPDGDVRRPLHRFRSPQSRFRQVRGELRHGLPQGRFARDARARAGDRDRRRPSRPSSRWRPDGFPNPFPHMFFRRVRG